MSTAHVIRTVIEILVIVALIVGFLYEPVIAQWEEKQNQKMRKAFKKRKMYRQ